MILASLVIITQTRFTAGMSAFLPSHPSAEQAFLVAQIKGGTVSRTILMGLAGGDAAERAHLSQALGKSLRASGLFSMVRNGAASTRQADQALLFRYRYLLSPAISAHHFSVDGLHSAISDSIDLLSSPLGMLTRNLLTRDPTGEMFTLLNSFDANTAPRIEHGVWVSPDGQRALLMAQTQADGSDTDAMQSAIERIRQTFHQIRIASMSTTANPIQLIVTGAPVFSVNSRNIIKSDVKRFSIISGVAIMLLLLLAYRSVAMLFLGLLPVLSGILVAVAAVSLGFGTVHGITIGFGTTLIGESIDYSIYYFVQTQGPNAEVDRFWPTIRLGVLTSITGFAALLFSGFPGLAQIGLYSIAGLVTAATVTRFILPHLETARRNRHSFQGLGRWLKPVFGFLPRLRHGLIVLALAALVVLIWRHNTIWQSGLSGLSPIPKSAKQTDQRLSADMGAPDARYFVVVYGSSREAALKAAEQVTQVLAPLVQQHILSGFDSPTRFLPSRATQQARQNALPDRATLTRNLQQAVQGLPISFDKLKPFIDAVEHARRMPLLTANDLKGTSFGLALAALLQQQSNRWMALIQLHISPVGQRQAAFDPHRIKQALTASGARDALFIDMLGESNQLYNNYLNNTIMLSLIGLVAIIILLALTLHSPRRLLRVLTPLMVATVLVMAGLNLAGEKLTLLHLVGLLLIVAVGSNYALFFNQGRAPAPQTLASLALANLSTVIAFGILAFSRLPILHAFGSTVAPGAILALLLSSTFARPDESANRP